MKTQGWPTMTRDENVLEGCSRLLRLLACREKMFMVMASYVDPDGKSPASVAGLLASQYAWKDFDAQCRTIKSLDTDAIPYSKILESGGVAGIAALADSQASSAQSVLKASTNPSNKIDPGLLCFEHCVLEAARRMQPAPPGQTVCFVMDWQDPLASSALWHLEDLMNFSPLSIRERFGAIGFEHSDTFLPLWAAQLLARRCSEMRDDYPPSPSLHGLSCTFLEAGSLA